jgi:hypothetical protein
MVLRSNDISPRRFPMPDVPLMTITFLSCSLDFNFFTRGIAVESCCANSGTNLCRSATVVFWIVAVFFTKSCDGCRDFLEDRAEREWRNVFLPSLKFDYFPGRCFPVPCRPSRLPPEQSVARSQAFSSGQAEWFVFRPNLVAAPFGPPTTQPSCSSVPTIRVRLVSSKVIDDWKVRVRGRQEIMSSGFFL